MLIIIRFDGSFENGFLTTVKIIKDNLNVADFSGQLPPAPQILEALSKWKNLYNFFHLSLGGAFRIKKMTKLTNWFNSIVDSDQEWIIMSDEQFKNLSNDLALQLNQWLNSNEFRDVKNRLLVMMNRNEEITIIIQTDNIELQKLPWHLWELFDYYPKAEISFAPLQYQLISIHKTDNKQKKQVSILAILGADTNINIEKDREFLGNLPNAKVKILVKPSRSQLNNYLYDEKGWDIFCFSGHSETRENEGIFCINDTDFLTIKDLSFALKKAIERGLQIAIFNSCDGLGLANELTQLNLPVTIVMRDAIPDKVAQEFLENFLNAYAGGKSFYLAVREAREKLQGLEHIYPCVSWLPIICQNSAEIPPTWDNLRGS